MALYPDVLAPARSYADVVKNRAEGKISALLTVEDAVPLAGRIERVDEMFARGVRMAALLWNYENSLGFPNFPGRARARKAAQAVRQGSGGAHERAGHHRGRVAPLRGRLLGRGGHIAKAVHRVALPVPAPLCDHSRNLTDAQLRAVAEHGGIVGVNFNSGFLNGRDDYTPNADIIRHMDYIRRKAGIESVALGSDFDGIDCALELRDCAGLPSLAEAMESVFTDDEIDLISSKKRPARPARHGGVKPNSSNAKSTDPAHTRAPRTAARFSY